jgi:RND family efflux transporter MFP subunit
MNRQIKRWITSSLAIVAALLVVAVSVYRLFFYAPKIVVVRATDATVAREIHGPGAVQSRFPVVVSSRITATVIRLLADQGDIVRRGQPLVELDDRDLAARATAARTELEFARANYQRDREVFDKGYIAQAAMDATTAALRGAEAREREASTTLSYSRIAAPVGGVITARRVEAGQTVGPGTTLFRLADPRTLWVATRIDETIVGQVRVGQAATIALRTGEQAAGKVARIALESDAATRELEVDVAFGGPPSRFAIDQEAEVTIHVGEEQGVVIPASALFQQGPARGVLVVTNARAEFRPVKTGASDGTRVVVREGLAAGERVILRPGSVKPGSRVRAVADGAR